jgi:hypothetical protein
VSSDLTLTTRNAQLGDLVQLLQAQHDAKLDVVLTAHNLRSQNGTLHLAGVGEPVLRADGVTREAVLRPTGIADAGLADKLGIPVHYLRRLRGEHIGLYDANVNGWLEQAPGRRLLVRGLDAGPGELGVARAVLSDSYRVVDHLDVLMAALGGIREAGVQVRIPQCDLTEQRMYVKVTCPEVAVHAPALLAGYTSPFTGARGADNPLVHAGFLLSNSETGHGSFSLTPQLTVQVCNNGMTITRDVMREVHLGSRLPEGVVRWSADTQHAVVELVTKQARDAVTTFLDRDYVHTKLAELESEARVPVRRPESTIEHVGKALRFSADQQNQILEHFLTGGDLTSGGILHAVTSAAQLTPDADLAHDMERHGITAMRLAAAHANNPAGSPTRQAAYAA